MGSYGQRVVGEVTRDLKVSNFNQFVQEHDVVFVLFEAAAGDGIKLKEAFMTVAKHYYDEHYFVTTAVGDIAKGYEIEAPAIGVLKEGELFLYKPPDAGLDSDHLEKWV